MTPLIRWMAAGLGPLVLRTWFATIRLRWSGGIHIHPDPHRRGNAIYVLWHQRLLCFAYSHARFHGRLLISRSRDGEIAARVAAGLGFTTIRGSTRRGGSEAMRALLAEAGSGYDFGITPDGPRGPRYVFKAGAIYLASRTGLPIVPITVAYRHAWHCPTWDGLQIPWPFTRGVIHSGAPIAIPAALDASGIEAWRLRLEETLRSHTNTTDEHMRAYWRGGRRQRDL